MKRFLVLLFAMSFLTQSFFKAQQDNLGGGKGPAYAAMLSLVY